MHPQDDFRARERYLERQAAIKKARKRAALLRLIIRAVALALAIVIAVLIITKVCGGKGRRDALNTISDVEVSPELEDLKPNLPKTSADMITPADINSHYVVVLNCSTDEIIASKGMRQQMYPASLTKIMTLLVACEQNEDLLKTFTVTNEIIDPLYRAEATLAGFVDGEEVSILDLLYGTVLPSGAEAAECVAIATAGSVDAFVELMNQKVRALGLTDTHFANVTGLHDKNNYSTAYDMAVILREALKDETCRKIMETYQYTTAATNKHPEGVPLTATLFSYMYGTEPETAQIMGGKTGYTDQSGYCIATFGKSGESGTEYICITAKGDSRWPAVYDQIELFSRYAK